MVMMNVKHLIPCVLAILSVLLSGCGEQENPTRTSLEADTSTLTLFVGESAFRAATTKAEHYRITYTSSNPAVATVDRMGKVTGVSEGEAVITIDMAESIEDWYAPKKLTYNVVVKKAGSDDDGGVTPAPAPVVTVTDLSMVDNAGGARSTMSTANCYMVHTAGDYKLPLVYGNAIKDGADNTVAYKPGGTSSATYCANFENHAGTAITAPWITKATTGTGADKGMGIVVSTAELLWQDAQGLITAVGIIGDYLTLTVGKNASEQEGNAVIAAKDAGGNIVWSWHIWVTKETFADATLTTVATGSHNYKVTPVNLGWVPTSGDGKQGYAPYYQWGRKDPFKGTGAPADHTVYNLAGTAIAGMTCEASTDASTDATIADNIKNPTTHYYNSTNGPCNFTYYNMWDAQQTGTDNITMATKKTVYDPCPAGFCVPTGNLYYFMGNGISSRSMTTWDTPNKGATWNISTTGNNLFFPASGYRNYSSGTLSNVGSHGYYWSASPYNSNFGRYLRFYSSSWYWFSNLRAYGFPVRAVAEE